MEWIKEWDGGAPGGAMFWRGRYLGTSACFHLPWISTFPHPIIQHRDPKDGLSLGLGRQTGWMSGDQETESLSFRRARSWDRLVNASWITTWMTGSSVPFSERLWTPIFTEYDKGSLDLQDHGWEADHQQWGQTWNGQRDTSWAQGCPARPLLPGHQAQQGLPGQKAEPLRPLATLTDLCKQCAAVRTHWRWMREPLQMFMPRNRMLTCHGHLPTSTNFPFTFLQEMLVRPQPGSQDP